VARTRRTPTVFLHWLALRAAVNSAQLAGLEQALDQRLERWAVRSFELERAWRGR
jgi:hypothetical protein